MFSYNDPTKLEIVYNRVHYEHKCVTVKSLCIDFGISRGMAASMLEVLPYFSQINKRNFNAGHKDSVTNYEATYLVSEYVGDKTVIKLKKKKIRVNSEELHQMPLYQLKESRIFSLALIGLDNGVPSVQSGHQFTINTLPETLKHFKKMNITHVYEPEMVRECNKPHLKIEEIDLSGIKDICFARPKGVRDITSENVPVISDYAKYVISSQCFKDTLKGSISKPFNFSLPLSDRKIFDSTLCNINFSRRKDINKNHINENISLGREFSDRSSYRRTGKVGCVRNCIIIPTDNGLSLNAKADESKKSLNKDLCVYSENTKELFQGSVEKNISLTLEKKRDISASLENKNNRFLYYNNLSYSDKYIKITRYNESSLSADKRNDNSSSPIYKPTPSESLFNSHQDNTKKLGSVKKTKLILHDNIYANKCPYVRKKSVRALKEICTSSNKKIMLKDISNQNRVSCTRLNLPTYDQKIKKNKKQGNLMNFFRSLSKT